MAFHPHPDAAEVESRMGRYLGAVDKMVPLVGKRWQAEWLPMIRDRNEAERSVDYSRLTDAQLFAKYHEMTKWMEEMWYVHGHINFALISGAALSDFYDEVIQPDDPTEAYRRLRDEAPVYFSERYGFYALSRFADVVAAHRNAAGRGDGCAAARACRAPCADRQEPSGFAGQQRGFRGARAAGAAVASGLP